MATEKAMKVAREARCRCGRALETGPHFDTCERDTLAFATALDHHGAALARLAAVFMAQKVLDGEIAMVDDAVQHAKEAQDE